MSEFYYRVDTKPTYGAIKDSSFRMRRWSPDMCNGRTLQGVFNGLGATQGLFRMCFFRSWRALCNNATFVDDPSGHVFSRIDVSYFSGGAVVTRDDDMLLGEAVLMYVVENLDDTNAVWSKFNVPFSAMKRIDGWN